MYPIITSTLINRNLSNLFFLSHLDFFLVGVLQIASASVAKQYVEVSIVQVVDDTYHFVFITDLILSRVLMVLYSFYKLWSYMRCHSLMEYLWLWRFNLLHNLLLFYRLRQTFVTFFIVIH